MKCCLVGCYNEATINSSYCGYHAKQFKQEKKEHQYLRDQFAMHIMGGTCVDNQNNIQAWNVDKMAEWAYRAADAMLKARGGEER